MSSADANVREWTDEQRRAIDARRVSVSLSAGAGCGKTFVLTERFLAHFEPSRDGSLSPQQLGRLVAITFTERAAREMRERIRRTCHSRLLNAPAAEVEHWNELMRGLDAARISTIHSFCAALLRSRAVEVGIDPAFEVLEQSQADTLLVEVVEEELRRLVAAHDEPTLDLAGRMDLGRLSDQLRRLVADGAGEPWDVWLSRTPQQQVEVWADFHRQNVVPMLARELADSAELRDVLNVLRQHTPTHAVMRERRAALLDLLPNLQSSHDATGLTARLTAIRENARVQGSTNAKAWDDRQAYDQFKDGATKLRENIDKTLPVLTFDRQQALAAAEVGLQLFRIAGQIQTKYSARKRMLSALDFGDLLALTHQLLVRPSEADLPERIAASIHLLLVDEFQDTDPLQVELVRALCGPSLAQGKLFFVGDYKQSIYRFRGADPHVFRRLRHETPAEGQLSLTLNFRSQPAILDFVNAAFADELGEGYEPLSASRPQVSPTPAVEFLWAPADDGDSRRPEQRQREAEWIARRIRAMLDSQEPIVWDTAADKSSPVARAPQLRDFAILLRALTDVEAYENALRRHGIDYYLVGGHAFYAQQEVFDLVNLLRAVNSLTDDVSLLGVLRSAFFSLSDETLFWLARHPAGLWPGLTAAQYPTAIAADEQQRARLAAATLAELRSAKDRLHISQLITLALDRTGYDAVLVSEFLGERKLANLRKLVELARDFERSGAFGLADFIAQLSHFVVEQPKEALAALHAEDRDVVRLMTIHQSKGLEFPIVIVPDIDGATRSDSNTAHFDRELGPLVKLPAGADGHETVGGFELWSCVEKAEKAAEQHRLLYVATTRAADYLLLSGSVKHVGEPRAAWTRLLARRFDLATGELTAPLSAGQRAPKIRVTSKEPPLVSGAATKTERVDLAALVDELLAGAPGLPRPMPQVEPIPIDRSARREFSFSRLAGSLELAEKSPDSYSNLADPTADFKGSGDGRALGTLVHAVLESIDFAAPGNLAGLVKLHAERQLLLDTDEAATAFTLLEKFLQSPRARQLSQAVESRAEVEFLLAWPATNGHPDRLLRGYLDRIYRDAAGRWHVLDFKTNRVPPGGFASLAAHYEMQMLVYGLALEQILGAPPANLILHFLRTGEEHEFDWNDAARHRCQTFVNQAISAAISD